MKPTLVFPLLILCCATVVDAEVYTWTDEQGTVIYTDNPARIPARLSGRTQAGGEKTIRSPKVQKEITKHGKTWPHAAIPGNRVKSIAAARALQKPVPLEMQSEIKGHLGGDQKDPAPPSMKQPRQEPPGEQPQPASPVMKQPLPAASGDQPKQTPAGMKQPTAAPPGDQPQPASSGMEQPEPKQ
jgi:uncharacterized protein DUF4124